MFQKLVLNINKTEKNTSTVLNHFRNKYFNPISAYLRINSFDDFALLILLPQREFIAKEMLGIYDFISAFENKENEEHYHIQISLCDTEEGMEESYLRSDGFNLKHTM
jgi:hypothetical protein